MLTWDDYRRWLGKVLVDQAVPNAPAPELIAWSTDTRTIGPGQWFVPITGPSFDGHRFIESAMKAGAAGFFYVGARRNEVPRELISKGLAVTDALEAFQQAASGWRQTLQNLKLIGLTGSNGKTTTKEMLAAILRVAGPTFSTEGSFNNEVGVPKTLQQLKPEHQYAALEFGARMPGNIKFLCELGHPDVACLLNVGVAHLGIFGSVENLLNTKLEIFRNSPAHAVLVANNDDPRIIAGAKATGKKIVTFGVSEEAQVRVLGSTWLPGGDMDVRLGFGTRESKIRLGVAHQASPINAAAAAAMAIAAGVTEKAVVEGLQGFRGIKGRYLVHKLKGGIVIDDTYNANPDSMAAGLGTLNRAFGDARKVLVLGDMLELGDESAAAHSGVGELAAMTHPQMLVVVGADANNMANGARKAGLSNDKIKIFADVDALLAAKLAFADIGDVIYTKASNGVNLSRLVDVLLKELA